MTLVGLDGKSRSPRRRAKKAGAVYQDLKRRIIFGQMTPECPITEQALAQEFSCSQGTIREALLGLEGCGLVERRGYQGTYVTETTFDEAVLMADLRLRLETTGIKRAVGNISKDHMRGLRELAAHFVEKRAERDVYTSAEIDRKLHLNLFKPAGMPILEPILKRALLHLHRFLVARLQTTFCYTEHEEASHSDILDALENGDAERAQALLTRHIELTLLNLAPEIHAAVFPPSDQAEPALALVRSA